MTEAVTILAIIVGPILAVIVTRYIDNSRDKLQRKLDVFRSLMRTRKLALEPEHVGALNLVELEFFGDKLVIEKYRKYIDFRHSPIPPNNGEDQDRHFKIGENFLYDLLNEMGASLNYRFDKDDLKRFSYAPKGWEDEQWVIRKNARLLSELLEGRIALPVTAMPPKQQNPFPPAPEIE
jgi:hypothetical protein